VFPAMTWTLIDLRAVAEKEWEFDATLGQPCST
jgi:hypothetical protein